MTIFYRALLTRRLLPAAQVNEMKVRAHVAGTYGLGGAVVMVNVYDRFVPWARLAANTKTALCRG